MHNDVLITASVNLTESLSGQKKNRQLKKKKKDSKEINNYTQTYNLQLLDVNWVIVEANTQ